MIKKIDEFRNVIYLIMEIKLKKYDKFVGLYVIIVVNS